MRGRYIVLEGIDGVGKTTQAILLAGGLDAKLVREPTPFYHEIEKTINPQTPHEYVFAHALDRSKIARDIELTLLRGVHVVSDRSFISTMVYQWDAGFTYVYKLHVFMPKPDIVVYLDAPSETACRRLILKGEECTQKTRSELEELRRRYSIVLSFLESNGIDVIRVITENKSVYSVYSEIYEEIIKRL